MNVANDPDLARKVAILERSPLFRRLPRPALSELAATTSLFNAVAGTELTRAGEPADYFYLTVDGAIAITWNQWPEPAEPSVGTTLVGWSALVEPFTYFADVLVREDCEVLQLDARIVLELMRERPDVGYDVMTVVAVVARERFAYAITRLGQPIVPRSSHPRFRPPGAPREAGIG